MTNLAIAPATGPARRRPTLTIDLEAVASNTRFFAARATNGLMAVVKADGFGHGAGAVARTALSSGAERLGVTSLDEALALRSDGLVAPILSWLNPVDADWAAAVAQDVEVAVPSVEHLEAIARTAPGSQSTCSSTRGSRATERRLLTGPPCASRPAARSGSTGSG